MKTSDGIYLKLQTVLMAIQAVDQIKNARNPEQNSADDDLWFEDLSNAADELQIAYSHYLEENKITNFPNYKTLVKVST